MSNVGTPKTDGLSQMTGEQHTPFLQQVEGLTTDAGGTLIESDTIQYRQAVNSYASISNFYIDTGSANAYVLNPQGNFKTPIDAPATWNGMLIRFRAITTNTATATVNFAGLNGGVPINIVNESGNPLSGGEIKTDRDTYLRYNLATNAFILQGTHIQSKLTSATTTANGITYLPKNITIANNSTDSEHDIDFGAGTFNFDDGTGQAIASALTKRIDSVWFAGNNVGGLDTGAVANNTFYYMYAIYNPTTETSDFLFSASSSSPTMPSGYTKKQRIGALYTDGSANIRNGNYVVFQGGYEFHYKTNIQDAFHQNDSGTLQNKTLSVPAIPCIALLNLEATNDATGAYAFITAYIKNDTSYTISTSTNDVGTTKAQGRVPIPLGDKIASVSWGGSSSRRVWLYTKGWIEYL